MADTSGAQINARITQFLNDSDLLHSIVHGTDTALVKTEGGNVPSVARLIKEARELVQPQLDAAVSKLVADAKADMELKLSGVEALFEGRVTQYLATVGQTIDKTARESLSPYLADLEASTALALKMTRKTTSASIVLASGSILAGSVPLVHSVTSGQLMGVALIVTAPPGSFYDLELYDGDPALSTSTQIFHARMVSGNYIDRLPFYADVANAEIYAQLTNQATTPEALTVDVTFSYLLG